jgi:hypothetical protein
MALKLTNPTSVSDAEADSETLPPKAIKDEGVSEAVTDSFMVAGNTNTDDETSCPVAVSDACELKF